MKFSKMNDLRDKSIVKERKTDKAIAIPPARGIGYIWIFLSEGISTIRIFFAIFDISGVNTNDEHNDIQNIIISVVILTLYVIEHLSDRVRILKSPKSNG